MKLIHTALPIVFAAGIASSAMAQRHSTIGARPNMAEIARWSFNSGAVPAPYNTVPATRSVAGANAIANQLGMTNNYPLADGNTMSTANCDVTVTGTAGAPDPNPLSLGSGGFAWRIRGGLPGGNGWSISAPQYTQGAEFDCSTVGFSHVTFSFDWYSTKEGILDLQLQYNLNVGNPNGWVNYKGAYNGNQAITHAGDGSTLLLAGAKTYNLSTSNNVTTNQVDFSKIPGVDNNPNFGVRLVSAYDPATGLYLGATATGGVYSQYNNSSGNWRFDQIAFRGQQGPVIDGGL